MPSLAILGSRPAPDTGPNPGWSSRIRTRLSNPTVFLFVILTAQLMVVLDTTIVNVALPHIQEGLRLSGSDLSWVLNAYLLTFGGLLLLGARSGDLLGRRRTFLAGIAIFSLSSLFGGLAVTGWMLLSARALQGVGAALAAPSSLALLTTVFSDGPQRVRAIGLFTTVSAAGGAIGLVAGGALTQLVSWRWVMFVNVPIGLAVWALGRTAVQETERRHGHFDIAGALTSTLGMAGIVFGLVEAGADGWSSPLCAGALAAGVLLLGAFFRIETRAEEPIVPLRLFASGTRTASNVARGLTYAGMYGMFFFVGQFLQDVLGYAPLRTGPVLPAHADLGVPVVPVGEQGPGRPGPAEGSHHERHRDDHRRPAPGEPAPRRRFVVADPRRHRPDGSGLGDRHGAPDHGRPRGGRAR
jgi:MFS family permease